MTDPSFPGLGVEGCDAEFASIYYRPDLGKYVCRCIICARCEKHTGNANYGHYTGGYYCKNAGPVGETKFHFCCPNDCELGGSDE